MTTRLGSVDAWLVPGAPARLQIMVGGQTSAGKAWALAHDGRLIDAARAEMTGTEQYCTR